MRYDLRTFKETNVGELSKCSNQSATHYGRFFTPKNSDFVPAIKLARMEGVQIFLAHLGHTVKPELKEHSDVLLDNISAAQ